MTLKVYLSGIVSSTAIALVAFLMVIGIFSPDKADESLVLLVFFSLFTALSGIFGLAGFFVRKKKWPHLASFKFLGISFRQGSLLAFLATGLLFFRAFEIIWPLSGLFLLLMVFATEYFFLKRI
ncbi:MAG: hypothetical protein PHQ47_00270 [Candidatus Portnoybacteria bacterium]|nr:hypothetical protein [Candidatus Portnoybacteria bacterium]